MSAIHAEGKTTARTLGVRVPRKPREGRAEIAPSRDRGKVVESAHEILSSERLGDAQRERCRAYAAAGEREPRKRRVDLTRCVARVHGAAPILDVCLFTFEDLCGVRIDDSVAVRGDEVLVKHRSDVAGRALLVRRCWTVRHSLLLC